MLKTTLYEYLGTNGTILSPVHLEDIYYIRKFKLQAENGRQLTKDDKHFFNQVTIPEADLDEWKEV